MLYFSINLYSLSLHLSINYLVYSPRTKQNTKNRPHLDQRPKPQLQVPQRNIKQPRRHKRELEPNIARPLRDWPDEPHLVDRRHDERAREQARAERGEPRRQAAPVVPEAEVVRREVAPPDEQVLGEDDGAEGARPVADEAEEVGERVVELVRADDGDGYEAGLEGSMRVSKKLVCCEERKTYMAVARIENMYLGMTASGGMKTWKLRLKE